ncbi:hypothetical protein V2W45_61433 [Cenococcum geophilum]
MIYARTDAPAFLKPVQDVHRFILHHKVAIGNNPLQTYASALMFSPCRSLIGCLFRYEEPNGSGYCRVWEKNGAPAYRQALSVPITSVSSIRDGPAGSSN